MTEFPVMEMVRLDQARPAGPYFVSGDKWQKNPGRLPAKTFVHKCLHPPRIPARRHYADAPYILSDVGA